MRIWLSRAAIPQKQISFSIHSPGTVRAQTTRGNAAIKTLRMNLADEYGQEVAGGLVPDTKDGAQLLKLKSAMHGTCNTANAVVPKLAEKQEVSSKLSTEMMHGPA